MRRTIFIMFLISTGLARFVSAQVLLDIGTAKLSIDKGLASLRFADGTEWRGCNQASFAIETDRGTLPSESVRLEDKKLTVVFSDGSTAEFAVSPDRGFIVFRLLNFAPKEPVRRFRLFRLAAAADAQTTGLLNAGHTATHSVALMAAEANVQAFMEKAAGYGESAAPLTTLNLQTHEKYDLQPAAFGLIACPREEFFETVERFQRAAGLPSPRPGGAWNKKSPWIKRSYFFLTGFNESQFDQALAIARRGGFDMILLGQESWSDGTGHYEINRTNFPDGLEGLQRTMRRFKDAGFHVGLHFLAASIYPPDKYITPVPDPRLFKAARATLAADIDEKAAFVPVVAAPQDFPEEDGGYWGNGAVLRIGDELILYENPSMQTPYGFTKCQRGHLGTRPAPHHKGDEVAHLLRPYGYHLYDMDTTLLDEVTSHFAKVADACDIDMIYFDGSERLQGDHWYYNARLQNAFWQKLARKDILLQGSSYSHYSWHLLARSASADGHGDLKGYLDERSPWFDSLSRDGMPLDIGWYYGYDPNATIDMYEYVLGATIGYDASMSFQVSVDAAARHPFTNEILDCIARYEKLRLSARVPEEMKARLRIDPILGGKKTPEERAAIMEHRREYRLLGSQGREVFQRVIYEPWQEVNTAEKKSLELPVVVKEGPARLGFQIHVQSSGAWLAAGPAYHAADAILLENFDDLAPYVADSSTRSEVKVIGPGESGAVSAGVSQRFELSEQGVREGKRFAVYTAVSTQAEPAGWSAIGKRFDPPLDISQHRGIGFWLRGDGRGGAFKLQLTDGKGATDYYVANDYVGWRYQQLPRPERDPIDYSQVRTLMFYYNGLPGKTTVACGIDDVKALPRLDEPAVVDPYVEVGGKRLAWKGTLTKGQYLVIWPGEPAACYGLPLNDDQRSGELVPPLELPAGATTVMLGYAAESAVPLRVRITLQPPESYQVPQ